MVTINYKQRDAYAKRLEKANLKAHGKSLSWVSMLRHVKVYSTDLDTGFISVDDNWKDVLKEVSTMVIDYKDYNSTVC